MHCTNCGTEVNDGNKFCQNCGQPINQQNQVSYNSGNHYRKKMDVSRVVHLSLEGLGALIILFACVMPLYSVTILGIKTSYSMFDTEMAFFMLPLIIIELLFAFFKFQKTSFWPGSLAVFLFICDCMYAIGDFSVGFYFTIIGFLCILAGQIVAIAFRIYRGKRMGRIKKIIFIVIAAVFTAFFVSFFVFVLYEKENENMYSDAKSMMEDEEYVDAISEFKELGNYEDSEEQIKECKYLWGKQLINDAVSNEGDVYDVEEGGVAEAKVIFSELAEYKDSDLKLYACDYLEACTLIEDEKYDEAIDKLTELSKNEKIKEKYPNEYEELDIQNVVNNCQYCKAEKLYNEGNYDEALKIYETLGDYEDSKDMVDEINDISNTNSDADSSYGIYGEYKCINESGTCTATISFSTGEDYGDYIQVSEMGEGGHLLGYYSGWLTKISDTRYKSSDERATLYIEFSSECMHIDVITVDNELIELSGEYTVVSLLDLNKVG